MFGASAFGDRLRKVVGGASGGGQPNDDPIAREAAGALKVGIRPEGRFEYTAPPDHVNASTELAFNLQGVHALYRYIIEMLDLNPRRKCTLGLSGGNTPIHIYKMLSEIAARHDNIDWKRLVIFMIDERYVPRHDKDNNTQMIWDVLKPVVDKLEPQNFIFPDCTISPASACAEDYAKKLQHLEAIDVVCLGMGPDGHLASWFPPMTPEMYSLAHDRTKLVAHTTTDVFAVHDRITVSMDLICAAARKIFFMRGQEKMVRWRSLLQSSKEADVAKEPVLQVLKSGGVTNVCMPPFYETEDTTTSAEEKKEMEHLTIVVFGASGDLAKKKTLPAIFSLYCEGLLPESCNTIGYSRTQMTKDEFFEKVVNPSICPLSSFFQKKKARGSLLSENVFGSVESFMKNVSYCYGPYSYDADKAKAGEPSMRCLGDSILATEEEVKEANPGVTVKFNRLFYLALPPTAFFEACKGAKDTSWSHTGWNRVVVEKPFGRDAESSSELSAQLMSVLDEHETYRIDHYLGKEMALNILSMRFANLIFSPLFHRFYVSSVKVTFKEQIGTAGRAGYFNQYGIIRDIIQNHLLQMVTLVAMEQPVSLKDEDIRDEKVKVLRRMKCVKLDETVVGQYAGYLEEDGVPKDSITPTFATTIVRIDNDRWDGVPFILKAGKHMEDKVVEIRVQLKSLPGQNLFGAAVPQNEIVFKVQPEEAIYMKVMSNKPGLIETSGLDQTELDFSVRDKFYIERMPDAYERLIYEVTKGNKSNFVRTDELREAWRVFTPLLQELEKKNAKPHIYEKGSRGPKEADRLAKEVGNYKYFQGYVWSKAKGSTHSLASSASSSS